MVQTDTMYLSHMSDLRAAVFSQSVTCDCKSCLDQTGALKIYQKCKMSLLSDVNNNNRLTAFDPGQPG